MCVQPNSAVCSCDLRLQSKSIFWLCVCNTGYPAFNKHAPCCCLWIAQVWNIFPHYLISGTIFKIQLLNIKCELWFCIQLLSHTSHSEMNWARYDETSIVVVMSSTAVRTRCQWNFFQQIFKKFSNMKFYENPFSWDPSFVRTEGQTDWHIWRS